MTNENETIYAIDDARREGWEAARKYFKEQVISMLQDWRTSEEEFDIEEAFENPEDEAQILREAALDSKGQP